MYSSVSTPCLISAYRLRCGGIFMYLDDYRKLHKMPHPLIDPQSKITFKIIPWCYQKGGIGIISSTYFQTRAGALDGGTQSVCSKWASDMTLVQGRVKSCARYHTQLCDREFMHPSAYFHIFRRETGRVRWCLLPLGHAQATTGVLARDIADHGTIVRSINIRPQNMIVAARTKTSWMGIPSISCA